MLRNKMTPIVGALYRLLDGRSAGADRPWEHRPAGLSRGPSRYRFHGLIRVDGPALAPLQGAMFQAPVVAQTVYTLGYPKLPRLADASVVMQPGAVTNEAVTSLGGESLFLYSAIARPGNSGGPVMSEDGYVVGLCTEDVTGKYDPADAFSPHYAGVPAQVVVDGVASLGLGIQLPFEHYE